MNTRVPVLTFYWKDQTKHVLPVSVCERYGLSDMEQLRIMCTANAYHGNVYDAVDGRHGFTLCSDESIRFDFQQLSLEEKTHLLREHLLRVDWANEVPSELVARYMRWRREVLPVLYRCLTILHKYVLGRNRERYVLPGLNRHSRLTFLTKTCQLASVSTQARKDIDMFLEYAPRPKQDDYKDLVRRLDTLFDVMVLYGRKLQASFTFVAALDHRTARRRESLYRDFTNAYRDNLKAKQWVMCSDWLHEAFYFYALRTWFLYGEFDFFHMIPK